MIAKNIYSPAFVELPAKRLHFRVNEKTEDLVKLVELIYEITGWPRDDKSRERPVVESRDPIIYYLYNYRVTTLVEIGKVFGGKNHISIKAANERFQEWARLDMYGTREQLNTILSAVEKIKEIGI